MRLGPASVLLAVVSLGCTHVPNVEPYAPTLGAKTCRDISNASANRSTEEFLWGTAIVAAGVTGVTAGLVWGPDASPEEAWPARTRHLLIIAPSAIVAGLGVGMMMHSQQTDMLAYQSRLVLASAQTEADRFLYYQCVSARGDWSGDHLEAMRIQLKMLKDNLAIALEAQQTAVDATTHAESASTVAADAKVSAAKAAQVASASAEATKELTTVTEKLLEAASTKDGEGAAPATKTQLPVTNANPRAAAGGPRAQTRSSPLNSPE